MQKVICLLSIFLPLVSHAAVDPAVVARIKKLTQTVIDNEKKEEAKKLKDSVMMENSAARMDRMLVRINTMEQSLKYFSRVKKKLTVDVMNRLTPEVSRACCPLNPTALQGQRWYFKGRGNKLKGKGLSGLRKKEKGDKAGKGKKGRKRGRGKKKNKAEG